MEAQNSTPKFVILGGGIAGLTAAIALKKIGIDVKIIEAAPEFNPVGAGIVLAVNALKAYEYLGIYDELCKAGNPISQMSIYDQKGKLINRTNTEMFGEGRFNLPIHRASLHKVLLSRLDESSVIKGKKSKIILDDRNDYTIAFEDGSSIKANYIIVAEGIHSATRQQFLPRSVKRYSGYTCWRGVANIPGLKIHEATETWGKNGRFGIVPLGGGKIYWFAVKNASRNDQNMRTLKSQDLLQIFKGYHDPIISIIRSTPDDQILWSDICDLKPVDKYAFGNIVMIGDAAHATTPNLGQGACQAIEDAVILAKCLTENSIVQEAFAVFEKQRIKRTHFVVNQSWRMGKVAQLENEALIGIRNCIFRLVPDRVFNRQLQNVYNFSA